MTVVHPIPNGDREAPVSPREVAALLWPKITDKDNLFDGIRVCFAESHKPGRQFQATAGGFEPVAAGGFMCADASCLSGPNASDGSYDYGIFQINSIWVGDSTRITNPGKVTAGGQIGFADVYDAEVNTRFAIDVIYSRAGRTWRPWAAYTNGQYLAWYPEAAIGMYLHALALRGREAINPRAMATLDG